VVCRADIARTNLSTPRQEAGGPQTNDVLSCQLVPLDRSSYTTLGGLPVPFTDAQWATLERTFPSGVCDWSKPGVGQGTAATWLAYGRGEERWFGGRELPAAPRRSGLGWSARSFRPMWRQ